MRRVVLAAFLLVLCSAGRSEAQFLSYIEGWESGSLGPWAGSGTVQTATPDPADGARYVEITPTQTITADPTALDWMNGHSNYGIRFKIQPVSFISRQEILRTEYTGSLYHVRLYQETTGKLTLDAGSYGVTPCTSTYALPVNAWTQVAVHWYTGAGGAVRLAINGSVALGCETTHSTNEVNWPNLVTLFSGPSTNNPGYYDSFVWIDIDWFAGVGEVGLYAGSVISRQGTAGTPTYTGGTKTCASCTSTNCSGSCATGTNCCATSETPAGTTKYVVIGSAAADTTLTCPFSSTTCTGAGSDAIRSRDHVNVCQVRVYAKRGSGSTPSANCTGGGAPHCILWRYNSTNYTYNLTTLTTSDAQYIAPTFSPGSPAALANMEHGMSKGTGTGRDITLEDSWVDCDYTPRANINLVE